jgi:hypothetical protein
MASLWVYNDLCGEGNLHVSVTNVTGGDNMSYGRFPLKAKVGDTVFVSSNWDRGCCYEVVGVFATMAEAKKKGGMDCSPHVVEG